VSGVDEFRKRTRATWAAGDWDSFSRTIIPVGERVLAGIALEPGTELLDVGTGSGGNIAIPAAQRGAKVVGVDLTPELFEHARRRAREAGVEVEWVEGDAQELPFADASFDRVVSTFGAMFAPDHARAGAELLRVCRPGGEVVMTTWVADGFAGELFKLSGAFMPPPPPGVQPPTLWGLEEHIDEVFAAAGASPSIERETVRFEFPSLEECLRSYSEELGPMVVARAALEPEGRWEEFIGAFAELVQRFNEADDGTIRAGSDYFVITVPGPQASEALTG
jgi:ubiquinone/menaquinone biosynthesis C-methylase UbiE